MDFTVNAEEAAVLEAAAKVAGSVDPWPALAEGGWLDLLVDDPTGGLGYVGLVAEALGAAGLALPLVGTAAVWPALFGDSAGGRRVAPVEAADGLGEEAASAEVVVVLDAVSAAAFEDFTAEPVAGLDGDGLARVEVRGEACARTEDPVRVAEARRRAAALAAAEMAGAIQRISEMTVAHVGERHQFGRPISSFQAVAHGAAQLATLAEAALWAARLACRSPDAGPTHAAKGWISRASQEASALAHQLHGAIGFTEEYGLQHLSKRLRTLRFAFGDDAFHFQALGRLAASPGNGDAAAPG